METGLCPEQGPWAHAQGRNAHSTHAGSAWPGQAAAGAGRNLPITKSCGAGLGLPRSKAKLHTVSTPPARAHQSLHSAPAGHRQAEPMCWAWGGARPTRVMRGGRARWGHVTWWLGSGRRVCTHTWAQGTTRTHACQLEGTHMDTDWLSGSGLLPHALVPHAPTCPRMSSPTPAHPAVDLAHTHTSQCRVCTHPRTLAWSTHMPQHSS